MPALPPSPRHNVPLLLRVPCLAHRETFLGSRTTHPEITTRRALVLGLLPPFDRRAVRWSFDCTQTSEASARPHLESGDTTSSTVSFSPGVPARFVGVSGAYLEAHYRLCPLDQGCTRIFGTHLDIGRFQRTRVSVSRRSSSGDIVWLNSIAASLMYRSSRLPQLHWH